MILDGRISANIIKDKIKLEIKENDYKINLAVILVGNDEASKIYIKHKKIACEYVGIKISVYELESDIKQDDLLSLIYKLNQDKNITGILVQLPLPKNIDTVLVMQSINYLKDVDGFNPDNLGSLCIDSPRFIPCTPLGIIKLLDYYKISVHGQNCVIIGRSNEVGKPLALLLSNLNGTVTLCHSKTKNLFDITKTADILISAVGKANFISADNIKPGANLIDVGINRDSKTKKICGDIDFDSCINKAKNITPVPGGVGPMTVAMLLNNCLLAYKLNRRLNK